MKRTNNLRVILSILILFSMLSPAWALTAGDGKKHFKEGMKYEASEDWDKAAEEFALAVSENPKNPEYKLHLMRSLFNACQMYIKKGVLAAGEKDYEGAYLLFRKAYAFDSTNELAKSEMERMVRLQQEKVNGKPDTTDKNQADGQVKMVKTSSNGGTATPQQLPQKLEKLRDLPFGGGVDLQFIIKELAKDLDLNVLFDNASFRTSGRKTSIELKNVTAARALDYIFLQEGLFFQKVGPRTILVANSDQRVKFQQMVLRTFYLANASPKDIAKVVQTAIPPQPGRAQTIVLTDDATNSITIRDTEENIRLIGQLINSLDKDRAEVVMDVGIYEVNKSDLLQFGNQIGSTGQGGSLTNLGGFQLPKVSTSGAGAIAAAMPFANIASSSLAFGLPVSNLIALQNRSNTRLIASTQIHAFNNEDSSATIGQRVPVRTAQISGGNVGGGTVGNNSFLSDVINYEPVGLTLKFKPIVFPNQDVQVAMEITSKDVAGAQTLTPTFTERTIKGTARVNNNKTLLLASVAQGIESQGRSGIPLLGLIPILGRLFSAPTRDNRQVDIVIAVTPRVIRAPAILPEDEVERPTGSMMVPTSNSLEAMIVEDERNETLAAARRLPTNVNVQLPDQKVEAPEYVQTSADATSAATSTEKPADTTTKAANIILTTDVQKAAEPTAEPTAEPKKADAAGPSAEMTFDDLPEMKAGEKVKVAVKVKGSTDFRSAVLGLNFDEKKAAIRSVTLGDVFGSNANSPIVPFFNQGGKMFLSLSGKGESVVSPNGTLAFIEIEALADGKPVITFEKDMVNFMTSEGRNFAVKLD
jgi:general secretion pathway protein D